MSAKKTGGSAGRQRQKDSAMAADMAKRGIKRNTCKCPVCYKTVGVEQKIYAHIIACT